MFLPSEQSPNLVRIAVAITLLGCLLFTFDLPLLRLSGADQWTMVFTRGVLLFLTISAAWGFNRLFRGDDTPFIAGRAGLLVALTSTIGNIAYIAAVKNTNAANVVFIIALTPVIAAGMSRLLLGETIHAFTWSAIGLAFLGASIIGWDGLNNGSVLGDSLAFVSAFCSAAAFTTIRGSGKKIATSLAVGNLASALIAALFFPLSFAALGAAGSYGVPAWVWLALNGVLAIPLATMLLASGSRFLPSAEVSMFFLLETVLTPLWIWLIFGETPRPAVVAGGSIIILTLISYSLWRLRQPDALAQPAT